MAETATGKAVTPVRKRKRAVAAALRCASRTTLRPRRQVRAGRIVCASGAHVLPRQGYIQRQGEARPPPGPASHLPRRSPQEVMRPRRMEAPRYEPPRLAPAASGRATRLLTSVSRRPLSSSITHLRLTALVHRATQERTLLGRTPRCAWSRSRRRSRPAARAAVSSQRPRSQCSSRRARASARWGRAGRVLPRRPSWC